MKPLDWEESERVEEKEFDINNFIDDLDKETAIQKVVQLKNKEFNEAVEELKKEIRNTDSGDICWEGGCNYDLLLTLIDKHLGKFKQEEKK